MMRKSTKILIAGGALFALLPQLQADDAKVYFTENYRNYGNNPPGVANMDGMYLGNDPIWADRAEIRLEGLKNPRKIYD